MIEMHKYMSAACIGCQEDLCRSFVLTFNVLQCMLCPGSNNFETVFNLAVFLLLCILLLGQLLLLYCYGSWLHTIQFYLPTLKKM